MITFDKDNGLKKEKKNNNSDPSIENLANLAKDIQAFNLAMMNKRFEEIKEEEELEDQELQKIDEETEELESDSDIEDLI